LNTEMKKNENLKESKKEEEEKEGATNNKM
jgi:hypothetical protein